MELGKDSFRPQFHDFAFAKGSTDMYIYIINWKDFAGPLAIVDGNATGKNSGKMNF